MKDFLENVVKNIVEQPDAVEVLETNQGNTIKLTISVADDDMGRVIGKDGKVINAIRMIMRVMAIRQNVRVRVDLEDRQRPEETQEQEYQEAPVVEAPVASVAPVQQTPEVSQPQQPTEAENPSTAADFVGQPESTTTVIDNSK